MTILSDHPSQSFSDDFLRMESRLAVILDILRHRNTRCPITIAIYGDWGTGKTSAMHWLESQLNEWNKLDAKKRDGHPRVYPVWFDPWKYHSREEVWRGIIAEVILSLFRVSQLDRHNFQTRITEAAKKFGAFLGKSFLHALSHTELTLKAEAGAPGTQGGGEVKFSGEMFQNIYEEYEKANHPEKAHLNQFEETLRRWVGGFLKEDERIALFIDDLDRCMPEVTLEVLEAIKLYLGIPQIMFVVGVDRDVVDSISIKHYETLGLGKEKARQYLDKIFQVEIQIPPSEQQMKEFLGKQVNALDKSTGGYWKQKLAEGHRKALEAGIRELARNNPRETKRLLNSTLLRGRAAADNPDLCEKHAEALLFAQGVQLFLIQRIVQNWISNGRNLLREDEAIEWFEHWSEIARKFVEFKPPTRESGDEAIKLSTEENQPLSDAEKAYEELKKVRLIGDDLKAVDKQLLLEDNLLWQLLRIPFSAEVAQSTPKIEETRAMQTLTASFAAPINKQQDLINLIPSVLRDRIAKGLEKPVAQLTASDLGETQHLDLSDAEISATDIAHLANLPALKTLMLKGTQIIGDNLTQLAKLPTAPRLEINFQGLPLTNADWQRLKRLPKVQTLNLGNTGTKDIELAHLSEMIFLDELFLSRNQITDDGLKHLDNLSTITTLALGSSQITDKGLAHIANHHPNIEYLFLDNNKLSETALVSELVKFVSLKAVWLRDMKISNETVAILKKQMPDTNFETEHSKRK